MALAGARAWSRTRRLGRRRQVIEIPTMILPKVRDPSLHDNPSRRDPDRLRSPSPSSLGGIVRGACSRPFRAGSAKGPTTASSEPACPRMGAWGGHHDPSSHGGRPCNGRGQRPARSSTACRLTLQAKPEPSRMWPHMSLVLRPTRSRPRVLLRWKARATPQVDLSADGNVTNFRRRFASLYLTTSGCGTRSAGQCLTAEGGLERQDRRQAHQAHTVSRPIRLYKGPSGTPVQSPTD
jgi:hypothetical protein